MSDFDSAPLPDSLPVKPDGMTVRPYVTLMHLSAFSGFIIPAASFLAPLVMWILKKDQEPLVDANGKNIMNFQISCLIYGVVFALLCFVLIGIPLLIALGIANFVCNIIGAIKANDGITWKYPLAIPFFK